MWRDVILMGMLNCSSVFSGNTLASYQQCKMSMGKQATRGDPWGTSLQKAGHPFMRQPLLQESVHTETVVHTKLKLRSADLSPWHRCQFL